MKYPSTKTLDGSYNAGGNQTWSLDAWGNWNSLTATGGGLSMTMAHNGANEITTLNFTSAHIGHDAAGNMTKAPKPNSVTSHYTMEYDPWNRLVKVTDGSTTVAEYKYDGHHRRIVKVTGSVQHHYYYNPAYQVVEVRKGTSTNPLERYVWHPYYIDALAVRYYDANTDGTGVEHYASHDGNYNVTALYNSTGSVLERYNYKPYGQLDVLNASHTPTGTTSSVANPYTYTGRRFDPETGLYYHRNRYYNSQLGRFITRDPIGYEGSEWNLYEFVSSAPSLHTDPFGLSEFTDWGEDALDIIKDVVGYAVAGSEFLGALSGAPDTAKIAIQAKMREKCFECRNAPPPCGCPICDDLERVKKILNPAPPTPPPTRNLKTCKKSCKSRFRPIFDRRLYKRCIANCKKNYRPKPATPTNSTKSSCCP